MIHSFLLIGQSNMAGRGFLHEAHNIDSSHIKILRNGRWQPMFRPVNPDRAFSGVNLAESFAEMYAQKYGVDVGLICCADGGTSLEQWKRGGLVYDNAVFNARLAMRTSTIAGVLWHQGEADCSDGLAVTYASRFNKILKSFREDLDLHDVPFLLGGLGDFLVNFDDKKTFDNYTIVNEQLQNVAQSNHLTGFVNAHGLGANPDNLHFNSAALYEFGRRYFEVFEKCRNPDKVFEEKFSMDDAVRSEMEKL